MSGHLRLAGDDNTAERIAVGMGHLVQKQNEQRAAADTHPLPADQVSDTTPRDVGGLHAGRAWRDGDVDRFFAQGGPRAGRGMPVSFIPECARSASSAKGASGSMASGQGVNRKRSGVAPAAAARS